MVAVSIGDKMATGRILWFLRPTLLVATCFTVAMLFATFITHRDDSVDVSVDVSADERGAESVERVSLAMESIRTPSASISPEEVVRIQLDALAEADQARGVLQCFTFASPGNRVATGPIERFGRMVRSEPYSILIDRDEALIGAPQFSDGFARVFVTVVRKRKLVSFVWVLSRQSTPPFVDCWMTEGVFLLDSQQQSPTTPDKRAVRVDEV
jgi:hypothetical protein